MRIEQSEIVDALQDIDEDPIRQILIPIVICCASAPFPPFLSESLTSMPRPHVEENRPAFPHLVLVFRHICVVLPAVTALPHRLTDARLHVALVPLGIEKEVSELQRHGRVREGHVVEEGVFRGLGAGCEAVFRSSDGVLVCRGLWQVPYGGPTDTRVLPSRRVMFWRAAVVVFTFTRLSCVEDCGGAAFADIKNSDSCA